MAKLEIIVVSALVLLVLVPGLAVGIVQGYQVSGTVTPATGGNGKCTPLDPYRVARATPRLLTVLVRNTRPPDVNLTTELQISWRPTTGLWIVNATPTSLVLKRSYGRISTDLGIINGTKTVTASFTMFFNKAGDYTLTLMALSKNRQFFGRESVCVRAA